MEHTPEAFENLLKARNTHSAIEAQLNEMQRQRDSFIKQLAALEQAVDELAHSQGGDVFYDRIQFLAMTQQDLLSLRSTLRQVQAERDEARAQRDEALSQLKTLGEELEEATVAHAIAENEAIDLRARLERQKAARKADQERTNATINNVVNQRENLYQQIASLRTAGAEKWQPIESAEKTTRSILVWCPENRNIYCVYWRDGKWMQFGGGYGDLHDEPTHWQPLPAPPAIGGKKASPGEGLA